MSEHIAFIPDWLSPPGDTIEDALEERGWTQADLAERMGVSPKFVNQLVRGKVALTPATAVMLASVLDAPVEFWLRREANYRAALARQEEQACLAGQVGWLDELPVANLAKLKWIPRLRDRSEQVAACLRFFGVASVDAWRQRYEQPLAAFRATPRFPQQPGAVAAWLRQAERQAEALPVVRFNAPAFRQELTALRGLTTESNPQVFVPELVRRCAACGVAVVFVPAPTGCRACGATRVMGSNMALLVLSLRYKTNDQLWFTFFHEAFHLLLHGRSLILEGVENLDTAQEREANQAAANLLIPPTQAAKLANLPWKPELAAELARQWGVAPGIVVGRLQHDGIWPHTVGNGLKVSYRWEEHIETEHA